MGRASCRALSGVVMNARIGLIAGALALSACGAGVVADGSDVAGTEDNLSIDFTYDCQGYGASQGAQLGLHLLHGKATVTQGSVSAVGTHDTHYHPPAGSTDARYKHFTG